MVFAYEKYGAAFENEGIQYFSLGRIKL
jgi:hypothetical protein